MSNFERFEMSVAKTDYTAEMKLNLGVVFMDYFLHPETLPEADKTDSQIIIRGHHIKHPFLSLLHEYPAIMDELGKDPLDFGKHPEFVNFIINRAINDAYAIANSPMHSDYIKDVLGTTIEELRGRVDRTIKMYKTILTGDPNRKVLLSVDRNDILCDSCVGGEHCKIGRAPEGEKRIWINNTIDAIFVTQLTDETENPKILEKHVKKTKDGSEEYYYADVEITLGEFRKALVKYYPKKKHLFEPDETD